MREWVLAAVLLAGCAESVSFGNDAVFEGPRWHDEGGGEIQPAAHAATEVDVDQGRQLGAWVGADEGPAVHLFLVDAQNYQSYREGATYTPAGCDARTHRGITVSCDLGPGVHYMVVEHADAAATEVVRFRFDYDVW